MARCLALLGMVATHLVDERGPTGDLTATHAIAGGRASALFAVLAGVTLALMTGGSAPVVGRERAARATGLAVRAALIAVLGLALGEPDSGLAVILTYYGLLFWLGIPFLALRTTPLAVLAGVWLVAAPVVSHLVRPSLPERGFDSPTFGQLADPGRLLSELAFTGYYPVLPWLAYLLAGMALGRMDLRRPAVLVRVTATGVALVVAAVAVSRFATSRPAVSAALLTDPSGRAYGTEMESFLDQISGGIAGTTPTGGPWQWLLVVAPHSGTPFDLAHTTGSALVVVGLALLAVHWLPDPGRVGVSVLFGAGAMTLTLYSLHVLMRTPDVYPSGRPYAFTVHALVLLGIGALYAGAGRRGPLEGWVTTLANGAAALRRGSRERAPAPGSGPGD